MKKIFVTLLLCAAIFPAAWAQSETDSLALCGTTLYSVDKGALLDVAVGKNDRPATTPNVPKALTHSKTIIASIPSRMAAAQV